MKTKTLGFIGGGRITRIILQSFENRQLEFPSIVVCDTKAEVLQDLVQRFPTIKVTDSPISSADQDIVFVALHPPVIMNTLDLVKDHISEKSVVILLAPKISIQQISGKLGTGNIARMIPNATSIINEGFNPISFSPDFQDSDKQAIMELLGSMGKTFEAEESKLEGYAIISAMLPTYFWFQWDEIKNAGLHMGLSEPECLESIQATLEAAIHLLYTSGLSQEEVMDLIPVKPIGEHEAQIKAIYQDKLIQLFNKIKPEYKAEFQNP